MKLAPATRAVASKLQSKPVSGSPEFGAFRAKVHAKSPEGSWQSLRVVARALFGEGVFEKGVDGGVKRLSLNRTQLRFLAEHPGKVLKTFQTMQSTGALAKDTKQWSASRAAAVFEQSAKASLPGLNSVTLTVATVNDDFTDRKTNLKRVNADVMLVQEAKNTNLRKTMNDTFGVHQAAREDKAGSAVVWKKGEAKATDRGYALGVQPNGAAMLTRWMSWTDMNVDGVKVRMISVHRPPKRYARLWPAFDAHLAAFVKSTKGPVVVGMDANQTNPQAMARRTGLKWVAPQGSIDGFLVSPGVVVEKMRRLAKGSSDHHPVVAKIRLKRPD